MVKINSSFLAQRSSKFDRIFAMAVIRNIKKYNSKYTMPYSAFDIESIKFINEDAEADNQILFKHEQNRTL